MDVLDKVVEDLAFIAVDADCPDDAITDDVTFDMIVPVPYVRLDLDVVDDSVEVLVFIGVDGDDLMELDKVFEEMVKECDTDCFNDTLGVVVDLYKPGELNPGCGGDINPECMKASPEFCTGMPIKQNNSKQSKDKA